MKTPNWWEITTPHKDITDGHFDESIFAADLGNVMDKNAPMEYMDGAMFFEKTYLTKGLKELLESVLQRTCGKGVGQSVIQLQTPFGGGKTHSLLGLFHLFKEAEKLSHIDAVKVVKKSSKVLFSNSSNKKKYQSLGYSEYMQLVRINNKRNMQGKIENIKIKKSFYKSLEAVSII